MSDLDSLVKGAPLAAGVAIPSNQDASFPDEKQATLPAQPIDPLSQAPSAPAMIYLNLLILEASLRAQFVDLRARRLRHTVFFLLLVAWVAGFGYALFLAPREDGKGLGGSIYWAVEAAEKVCFLGGLVTAVLVWATGIFERGIRWPRRWLAVSNRGLRRFNCKLVVIHRPWWAEALSSLAFFLTLGLLHAAASWASSHSSPSFYRLVDPATVRDVERELSLVAPPHHADASAHHDRPASLHRRTAPLPNVAYEEDLAPGGDYVKLLLLPKPFSSAFRENWELYRSEYWERENERRALLRHRIAERERLLTRRGFPWLWWVPQYPLLPPMLWPARSASTSPFASSHQGVASATTSAALLHSAKDFAAGTAHYHTPRHLAVDRERKRRCSGSSTRRGSTSSSRSQTPLPKLDDQPSIAPLTASSTSTFTPTGIGPRKASSASTSSASEKRRKKAPPTATSKRPGSDSRSGTPEPHSALSREFSSNTGPVPFPASVVVADDNVLD